MTTSDFPVVVVDDRTHLRALADLRWRLDQMLSADPPVLVVDLSGLSRLSSAAMAVLLRTQRCIRHRGGTVVLRGVDDRHPVLTRTSLQDRFPADPGESTPIPKEEGR
jgi:anti-anti-sigma regulatory factor